MITGKHLHPHPLTCPPSLRTPLHPHSNMQTFKRQPTPFKYTHTCTNAKRNFLTENNQLFKSICLLFHHISWMAAPKTKEQKIRRQNLCILYISKKIEYSNMCECVCGGSESICSFFLVLKHQNSRSWLICYCYTPLLQFLLTWIQRHQR